MEDVERFVAVEDSILAILLRVSVLNDREEE